MIVAVLFSLLGAAFAIPAGHCQWSPWSSCSTHGVCISPANMKTMTHHYPMEPTTYDKGREAMKQMMMEKQKMAEEREACIKAGNCEDLRKPSVTAAITPCVNGLSGEYACHNVEMLSFLNFDDLGYTPIHGETPAGNDIWVWHDTVRGDTYAIACTTGGTAFVRITDPVNPVPLGFLRTHSRPATWRDAKVIGDFAYIVADVADHGLQVVDLRQFRDKTEFSIIEETNFYGEFGNSHNIAADVETNRLYAVGCTQSAYTSCRGGLHIIDVSNPGNPVFVGCFADDGYVHDTQCVIYHGPDTTYTGREICFCFNEDTFTIVDVTNGASPTLVSKTGYNSFYTHQGWVTDDHTIVLLDDELDERNAAVGEGNTNTYVWDINDLDAPVLRTVFKSVEKSIDHNQYIYRGYTFQSNYEAGLRILWVDQPNYALIETGFFDVYPPSTTPVFRGTWSNYPYNMPLDSVAVMSIDYGMYMLRPDYAAMEAEKTQTRSCGATVESRTCQASC